MENPPRHAPNPQRYSRMRKGCKSVITISESASQNGILSRGNGGLRHMKAVA